MIPVYLHTPAGELLQRLEVVSASFGRNYDQIGTMNLVCEIPKQYGYNHRVVVDLAGESNVLWTIVDYEELAVGNRTLLSIDCQDGKRQFNKRIVLAYNDTAAGYKINYPQVVCAEVINENMVSHISTERNVLGLQSATVNAALSAGWTAWEGEVAWKKVWDVITTLMEYGRATSNPFYVDFLTDAQGGATFTPIIARRAGVERTVNSMQLARYGLTVRAKDSGEAWATRVIGLGSGDGSLALWTQYPTSFAVSRDTDPFFYSEEISSQGNEDDLDALTSQVKATYADIARKKSIILEGAGPVRGFWGSVIGYGDGLTLRHRDIEYQVTVVGYSISWEGAGEPQISLVCAEGY